MALSLQPSGASLVDQVEECLLSHFKCKELVDWRSYSQRKHFGRGAQVARSVLRECLSRLKMFGMIHSSSKRDDSRRAHNTRRHEARD